MTLLTEKDTAELHEALKQEHLQCYTVVVMGLRDLEAGNLNGCMHRLRVDADKFHSDDVVMSLIKKHFNYDWK